MKGRVYKTLAMLLLAGVTGCASGPFHHRKTVPPPALGPSPPDLSQTPLYSPEMSDGNPPAVPNLPVTAKADVLKPPPPEPQKPQKKRKPRPPAVTAKAAAAPPANSATDSVPAASAANPPAAAGAGALPAAGMTGADKTGTDKKGDETQQAAVADGPAASPIGDLMAGNSAETAQISRQAEDLIKATKDGLNGIKRPLSADEKKTVVEIGTFLRRADQALKNGDGDGAYGLATKAKLLLDELTQK